MKSGSYTLLLYLYCSLSNVGELSQLKHVFTNMVFFLAVYLICYLVSDSVTVSFLSKKLSRVLVIGMRRCYQMIFTCLNGFLVSTFVCVT